MLNNFFINNFMNIIRFFSTFMTFFKFLCISFHLVVPLTKSKKKMLLQFFCFYNWFYRWFLVSEFKTLSLHCSQSSRFFRSIINWQTIDIIFASILRLVIRMWTEQGGQNHSLVLAALCFFDGKDVMVAMLVADIENFYGSRFVGDVAQSAVLHLDLHVGHVNPVDFLYRNFCPAIWPFCQLVILGRQFEFLCSVKCS